MEVVVVVLEGGNVGWNEDTSFVLLSDEEIYKKIGFVLSFAHG